MVEFALIIPVFLLIFFGTIEFALILASIGGFNFAARDAARIGSFVGRGNLAADALMVGDANSRVNALVMAKGIEFDIFRATAGGSCYTAPTGPSSTVGVDIATCAADRYNMDGTPYLGSPQRWPVGDRDDTLANADYLGVRIVFQYNWLTAFVADTGIPLRLSAISVQRIEPLEFTRQPRAAPLAVARTWVTIVRVSANASKALGAGPALATTFQRTTPVLWLRALACGGRI